MTTFGAAQLLVDVLLLFLILVMLAGRAWRRGRGDSQASEHEAYRDMSATLAQLIREMKGEIAVSQDRLTEKQLELQRAIGAADERLAALQSAAAAPLAVPRIAGVVEAPAAAPARQRATPAVPAPLDEPEPGEERRERYRQALEFSEKGWSALDIARVTKLPRGEVDLLIRTKGRRG